MRSLLAESAAMSSSEIQRIGDKIRSGNRRQLAKAITRAESSREEDRHASNLLLDELLPYTGGAMRIGVSGMSGVGKSTFIETLGTHLCNSSWRVAVLSVDPSSSINGGSILGDKTRMPGLSAHPNAYIRPTPSGKILGGVAGGTRESILLCEAAGFNVILVETVGVGQSEIAVAEMTDIFVLLLLPSAGDELQGIKRGIVERADIILINKADGDLINAAHKTVADYRSALQLLRSKNEPDAAEVVFPVSAISNTDTTRIWDNILSLWRKLNANNSLENIRKQQRQKWLRDEIYELVYHRFLSNSRIEQSVECFQSRVASGELSPGTAADQIIVSLRMPD